MAVKSIMFRQDVEYLMKEEVKNRRKLRLLQVRQQNQAIASNIRKSVEDRRCKEIKKIAKALEMKFKEKQEKRIDESKENYLEGLQNVGNAHNNALNLASEHEVWEAEQEQNKSIAKCRFNAAIGHLHLIEASSKADKMLRTSRRKIVREKENIRAKHIAMLPKHLVDNEENSTKTTSMDTTSSIFKNFSADRSDCCHAAIREMHTYDAKVAASVEQARIEALNKEKTSAMMAMKEKAYLRHLSAVKQAKLRQDFMDLEEEIKFLQRKATNN